MNKVFLIGIVLLVYYHISFSQLNELKLLPSINTSSFGRSVSIDGDYALVGASGVAFVFKKSGNSWIQQQILVGDGNPPGSTLPPDFGYSVSISGNYAIVGAPFQVVPPIMSNIGAAYIFKRNGEIWDRQEKIPPPVGHLFGLFGWSVAISNFYAVVGEASNNSAYIYERDVENWTLQSSYSNGYRFGEFVSISGDYISVGTVGGSFWGAGQGSAFIFFNQNTNWTEQANLQASDGLDIDGFGEALSISSTNLLAGDDKAKNTDSISTGAAYIFNREDTLWVEGQKITAHDGSLGDLFGASVSISDSFAIVSAPKDQDNGINSGSAYLFRNYGVNWIEEQKFLASDGAANDNFGISVSISGNNIIVGANGNNVGSAYIYSDFNTNIVYKQISNLLSFNLYQNYPNPFNPTTNIRFGLPKASQVKIEVYNMLGQRVAELLNENKQAGYHTAKFDGSYLSSGIYFYKIQASEYQQVRKMLLVK